MFIDIHKYPKNFASFYVETFFILDKSATVISKIYEVHIYLKILDLFLSHQLINYLVKLRLWETNIIKPV